MFVAAASCARVYVLAVSAPGVMPSSASNGGGVLYVKEGEGTKNELEPFPVVNIRLGKSW